MNPTDAKIRALLQLKKLESPGPEYFDAFLDEFHRYQRTEILRQPSWQERVIETLAAWNPFTRLTPSTGWALTGALACLALLLSFLAIPSSTTPTGSGMASMQEKWSEAGYVAAPSDVKPEGLPEEITLTSSSFDQDFASPRYVTGQALVAYDTSLAF